jgi:hypothetical protein
MDLDLRRFEVRQVSTRVKSSGYFSIKIRHNSHQESMNHKVSSSSLISKTSIPDYMSWVGCYYGYFGQNSLTEYSGEKFGIS